MATVNFTGAVDRDLLKRAKVIAAKTDTSVNALFNAELRHLVETYEAAEVSGNQNFKVLLDFSLGKRNSAEAMQALGIDSEEDLFLLMAQAHLPMPKKPKDPTSASSSRGEVEQKGWLASATEIERQAIQAGRNFSRRRFPPE